MADLIDIPGSPYCVSTTQAEIVRAQDERVSEMRSHGQLSPQALERIRKYFRIKNIYHSNAIEGNVLDVGETRQVVEMGLTLTGKPLKDQAEARNLAGALDLLEELAKNVDQPITERELREIHALVLAGIDDENAGAYRKVKVTISGSQYEPPGPESVPVEMSALGEWLKSSLGSSATSDLSGLVLAVAAHAWFVTIHPFVDGNGRVGRLLMNLILMRNGFPIAVIAKEDRLRYYDALEDSQSSDLSGLVALVSESVEESLEEYERAVAEQVEHEQWAHAVVGRFTHGAEAKAHNEYELWKSSMDLMRSYFRQTAQTLDDTARFGRVYFKDFGTLEFEKYASLKQGGSAKRTWFFRIDFRTDDEAARYLFFFGRAGHALSDSCDVTAFVAREEGQYNYKRLDNMTAPNLPDLREVGYVPASEQFIARYATGGVKVDRIEVIGRQFIEQVVAMHFSS